MNNSFRLLFQPIKTPRFPVLFLAVLILVTGSIAIFIRPGNLDQSDFMLIAWEPGQQLLKTGSVDATYPYPLWTMVVMLPLAVWTPKTAMPLLPIGYGVTLVSKMKKREQFGGWLLFFFLIMYPLMFLLFIFIGIPQATQAYQIIPVLIFLPIFTFLENKTTQAESLHVEPTLSR